MCSNYHPVTRDDRLLQHFGVGRDPSQPPLEVQHEAWPLGLAPFIRLSETDMGLKVLEAGQFGLLPHFAKEVAYGRKTYNARSETVHQLASFRDSWRQGRRCIIPAERIFEPCYETGTAVRWCIEQPGGVPLGIAGIWAPHRRLQNSAGESVPSFAMLTVNAAGHPVFQRMHAPHDEKRMVVILGPEDQDRWLQCTVDEAPLFFKQWHGVLDAYPAPLPPRTRKVKDAASEEKPMRTKAAPKPPAPPADDGFGETGDLF